MNGERNLHRFIQALVRRSVSADAIRRTLLSLPGVRDVGAIRVRRSWLGSLSVAASLTVAAGGPGLATTMDEAARLLARRHGATHVNLEGGEIL